MSSVSFTAFFCSVDDFCCFLNLISTHDSLVKPAHNFFFLSVEDSTPKIAFFLVYRYGFQVAASCVRYGSLHQWPFIRDLLQVLFPFFILHHLVFIMLFILDCTQMDAMLFFFLNY